MLLSVNRTLDNRRLNSLCSVYLGILKEVISNISTVLLVVL